MNQIRESKIETDIVNYAKSLQFLVFKFVSPQQRGVPDRIFIKSGVVLFIEFKRPGGKLTKLQEYQRDKLIKNGMIVRKIDNINEGKQLIDFINNITNTVNKM